MDELEMRECPECQGVRKPCSTCMGRRIVPGKPNDGAEAARVAIAQSICRNGLRATYERLRAFSNGQSAHDRH